jgi:enoyl-CoA hydratase/carnithine racemase
VRNCGLQIGSEIAMTGRRLTAQEALDFHLINKVSKTPESVIDETVEVARKIASLSPDAIIVTRHGLRYVLDLSESGNPGLACTI